MAPKVRPRVFSPPTQVEVTTPLSDPILPSKEFKDELPVLGDVLAPASVEAKLYTSITLNIPLSLFNEYSRVATIQGLSVEEVLQSRLTQCRSHNALRGLWFSDSERAQLEALLQKRPIETPKQVINLLTSGGAFKVEGLEITLTTAQKKVLDIRARNGMPPKRVLEDIIRRDFQV